MIRLNALLAVMLVICALGLVTSQHRARKLFIDQERAQIQSKQLEVQWSQLELEQSALTKNSLIDGKARRNLAMQPIVADRTLHLNLGVESAQTALDKR
jgi:cell division protein FtsL